MTSKYPEDGEKGTAKARLILLIVLKKEEGKPLKLLSMGSCKQRSVLSGVEK